MKPQSDIVICSVPELSPDYKNTWRFESPSLQLNYFYNGTRKYTFQDYTYLRKEQAIKVEKHIDEMHSCNYLFYSNGNKWYYCFIIDKEYINEKTTKLYIQTDLLQTYMFDYTLKESYVERCHVNRWDTQGNPSNEFEPENLEYGENILEKENIVYNYSDAYVVVASNPLGYIKSRKKEEGSGSNSDTVGGDFKNGIISSSAFRFMKGREAYAPYHYKDSGGVLTIGYGITQHGDPEKYNELLHKEPAPEQDCAEIMYNRINNKYAVDVKKHINTLNIKNQNQFDALVDFCYNAGAGIFNDSSPLYKALKSGDEQRIRSVWASYKITDAGGIRREDLVDRRKQEIAMYFGEYYSVKPIMIYGEGGKPTGQNVTENGGNGWLPD